MLEHGVDLGQRRRQRLRRGIEAGEDEPLPDLDRQPGQSELGLVEVEVDTESGRVRLTKYVAVHDCGRIINPLTAESQIKGGATMGIYQSAGSLARVVGPPIAGLVYDRLGIEKPFGLAAVLMFAACAFVVIRRRSLGGAKCIRNSRRS